MEAFLEEKGQHQRHVRQLRAVLREKYNDSSLDQSQMDDIYWAVFLDSRQYFRRTEGKPTSGLDALIGALSRDQMPQFVGVPYHRLSPSADSKRQKLSDGAYSPGGGGGKQSTRERACSWLWKGQTLSQAPQSSMGGDEEYHRAETLPQEYHRGGEAIKWHAVGHQIPQRHN